MIFQTITLAQSAIKTRWQEPYVTAGLNQKALASDVRGVVMGFRVFPNSGYTVEVRPDVASGLSIANVIDTSGTKFSLTIILDSSLFIDLTAQANSTVYIVLDAQYSLGSPSGAQVRVVDAAELLSNPDLLVLAKVVVPAAPPVATANINMGYRVSAGDSLASDARPPSNLLVNGTFERDVAGSAPGGWQALSGSSLSPTVDAAVARTGTQSLRLSSVGVATGSFATGFVAVEAGQTARAGAWIRSTGGSPIASGAGASVSVVWFDPAYAQLSSTPIEAVFAGGSTTFEQRLAEVTAPAGAAFAKVAVNFTGCSGTLYVDDVQFTTRSIDGIAQSAVFGGSNSVADQYHAHAATGLNYAGSSPNNWADGTNLPSSTVEVALDNIVIALGGTSGAAKVGYTPTTPVDLTGVTRVDQALNTLDDLKAGINQPNTFSKTNTFTPSVTNTSAIVANGNGTSPAIQAIGAASSSGSAVLGTTPSTNTGAAVFGFSAGSGAGVAGAAGSLAATAIDGVNTGTTIGVRGQSVGGIGVKGIALASTNPGVQGIGFGAGPGVQGTGGASGAGVSAQGGGAGAGVSATGGATGPGGVFQGGASHHGLVATGGGTLAGAIGVDGVGGTNNGVGVRGTGKGNNYGVQGIGGTTSGIGVYGQGGTTDGVGVHGEGTGAGYGVEGHSASVGVYGSSSGSTSAGVQGQGGTNGPGVLGEGGGIGAGVLGFGNGAFSAAPNGTGVYGQGVIGIVGTSNSTGSGAIGVKGTGGPDGSGVEGLSNDNDTLNGVAAVFGKYNGGMQGYGVYGITFAAGGAGVRGEGIDPATPGGWFLSPGAGVLASGFVGGWFQTSSTDAIRSDGYIGMDGGPNPAFNDAIKNKITKLNVAKAWCMLSWSAANIPVIYKAFNISGVTTVGSEFQLNFAQPIGNAFRSFSIGAVISGTAPNMVLTITNNQFNVNDIGTELIIFGAPTGANNGTFRITNFTNSNTISYSNGSGVAETIPGGGGWTIALVPAAVALSLDDSGASSLVHVRLADIRSASMAVVLRDNLGALKTTGLNQFKVGIIVYTHQY